MLTFRFSKADGQMTERETLTSGMIGAKVKLEFSEDWKDYSKIVVFTAGTESRDVTEPGEVVAIPHEVLEEARNHLYVGVYGVAPDGRVIPSLRVQGPYIYPGVNPEGDESTEPTLPVWAQIKAELTQLREEDMLHITADDEGNITVTTGGV